MQVGEISERAVLSPLTVPSRNSSPRAEENRPEISELQAPGQDSNYLNC
jgi:hypothetical protein